MTIISTELILTILLLMFNLYTGIQIKLNLTINFSIYKIIINGCKIAFVITNVTNELL